VKLSDVAEIHLKHRGGNEEVACSAMSSHGLGSPFSPSQAIYALSLGWCILGTALFANCPLDVSAVMNTCTHPHHCEPWIERFVKRAVLSKTELLGFPIVSRVGSKHKAQGIESLWRHIVDAIWPGESFTFTLQAVIQLGYRARSIRLAIAPNSKQEQCFCSPVTSVSLSEVRSRSTYI